MTAEQPASSEGQYRDRSAARRLIARAPTLAIALGCALVALYLGVGARDAARLDRASELGAEGHFDAAAARAHEISTDPARARAAVIEAYAFVEKGDDRRALPAFARAAAADPRNWQIHRDWASALLRLGDTAAARARMGRALALNPFIALPPGFAKAR